MSVSVDPTDATIEPEAQATSGSAGILPASDGSAGILPASDGSAGILSALDGSAGILSALDTTDAKIVSVTQAIDLLASARDQGQVVVLTNGVFDLLHAGHVYYLQEARALGDLLVVALNSDASVRRLKGPSRPLTPLDDRAVVVAALACVDLVVSFAEDTAERLVARLRPDVYVKGGDYTPTAARGEQGYLPEAAVVASYGGRVHILSYLPGRSTSELVRRVRTGGQ